MSASGPLSGITVVDLTRVLAGPYCTMVLADLGARVIKVEMPVTGDDSRQIGPFIEDGDQVTSAYFFAINRNKESIALNLKNANDQRIFERLLDEADVLVENYTPGTLARLGYGWDRVHARWPRLTLASISGFGQTGPYRELPAYDMVVQAMGGILSVTGEEGGTPTRVGISIGDIAAGLFGTIGIQAALLERARTGLGKYLDVAMLDCQVALLENALARFQVTKQAPGPIGSRHPSITPFGVFAASDGRLVVAAGNDLMFRKLCEALDRPHLSTDPRFATNPLRCEHHAAMKVEVEAALAAHTVDYWLAHLRERGLPCGPLNDVSDVMQDPQVAARDMLVDLKAGPTVSFKVAGNPVRFGDHVAGDAPFVHRPAPRLDQHRAALLDELGIGASPAVATRKAG